MAYAEQGELKAKAFLFTQNLDQLEALDLAEFRVFQVTLDEIEERAHIHFRTALHKGGKLLVPEAAADRAPLENLSDINWD
ncbi:hypothetical protein [Streptomyces sp. NPDC058086]|uniref:hypothetical protein n=1 Tax=Streptomyces sp. NPDC058086 TaxID=3346334 RepID=UPI0036E62560